MWLSFYTKNQCNTYKLNGSAIWAPKMVTRRYRLPLIISIANIMCDDLCRCMKLIIYAVPWNAVSFCQRVCFNCLSVIHDVVTAICDNTYSPQIKEETFRNRWWTVSWSKIIALHGSTKGHTLLSCETVFYANTSCNIIDQNICILWTYTYGTSFNIHIQFPVNFLDCITTRWNQFGHICIMQLQTSRWSVPYSCAITTDVLVFHNDIRWNDTCIFLMKI